MAAGMGGGMAELPPEELASLAAIMASMPPEGAPMPGGPPMPMAPPAPMGAPGPLPGFPSTDPGAIAALRAQDHAQLDAMQDSAMATAAASMGGAAPAALPGAPAPAAPMPGVAPLGGDPFAGGPAPAVQGLGVLPPELAAAYGGPDMGGMEAEGVVQLPGAEFASELGAF